MNSRILNDFIKEKAYDANDLKRDFIVDLCKLYEESDLDGIGVTPYVHFERYYDCTRVTDYNEHSLMLEIRTPKGTVDAHLDHRWYCESFNTNYLSPRKTKFAIAFLENGEYVEKPRVERFTEKECRILKEIAEMRLKYDLMEWLLEELYEVPMPDVWEPVKSIFDPPTVPFKNNEEFLGCKIEHAFRGLENPDPKKGIVFDGKRMKVKAYCLGGCHLIVETDFLKRKMAAQLEKNRKYENSNYPTVSWVDAFPHFYENDNLKIDVRRIDDLIFSDKAKTLLKLFYFKLKGGKDVEKQALSSDA